MTDLEKAKETIVKELQYSDKAMEFFKNAMMDDILTVSIILKALNISESMSIYDYQVIKGCIEIAEDNII